MNPDERRVAIGLFGALMTLMAAGYISVVLHHATPVLTAQAWAYLVGATMFTVRNLRQKGTRQ